MVKERLCLPGIFLNSAAKKTQACNTIILLNLISVFKWLTQTFIQMTWNNTNTVMANIGALGKILITGLTLSPHKMLLLHEVVTVWTAGVNFYPIG